MKQVKCISERKSMPGQLEVGKFYWMDESTKWSDRDGDEYAQVYRDEKKTERVGDMLCSHFVLEDESKGYTVVYFQWGDGMPVVAGRFKTEMEKDDFLNDIHKDDSGWTEEELSTVSGKMG